MTEHGRYDPLLFLEGGGGREKGAKGRMFIIQVQR